MIQQKKSTTKTPWDPNPFTVTQVKGSQVEVKRGQEVKKRAMNLIKKIKFRKGVKYRETKENDEEDPDIDVTIEEIRRRIREEKEAAAGGPKENPVLEESTDSEFTVTFDGDQGAPEQESEEEGANDSVAPEAGNDEGDSSGGKPARLSPRQRQRRQSLARFKRKKWGEEWII